ncbi:hypothetical protein [Bradyrhizobium sp. RDI18]|uniref:hypothetical protein n=1 Tax=Bradyrhizobium sp. RDI18 TaxID=3367400 RepID=UPI003711AD7C
MSIKRILVPLPGSASHTGQIETALSAAKALGAHVQALFISEPPPVTRGGLTATEMGRTATVALANRHAEERERAARDAREVFAQACAAVGIPMLSVSDEPGSPLAASWREAEGSYVEIAVQRAAAFDLMVAASATVMESLMAIAEQSLLRTRRPVLLAAASLQSDLTGSVMIAWDESPECWHAVSAAIPFMQLAKSVQVISVDRDASNRQASQAEVLAYLRCHGIAATAQVVAPRNCAQWAIRCSRPGQSMKPACWSWAPIPTAACAKWFWAGPRATSLRTLRHAPFSWRISPRQSAIAA